MKAMATKSRATKRILYIDQSEDCRCLLTILLEAVGYEVNTATTIANGLRLTLIKPFDLFIVESSYTDGLGTDLCRYIRTLHPRAPIIFFSTSAHKFDIEAAMAAGAAHYLTKPMDIRTIEKIIVGLLGKPVKTPSNC